MSNWIISRLVDLLLVFVLVTLLLGWGVKHYPAFFPDSFQQYWNTVSLVSAQP